MTEKKHPKVSVIIPCYNAAKTICRCLNSVLNQTYENFDIIVVDDCSSDCSVSLIQTNFSNNNSKIRLILNQKNCGPSLSRRVGILQSNSDYLMFCDSDDYYEANFIQKMIESIETNHSDICICNYNIVKGKNIRKHQIIQDRTNISIKDALVLSVDALWCCCFLKTLFDNLTFPDIRNGEDMAILPLIFTKASSICSMSDCLYNYVYQKKSLSNDVSLKSTESLINSFDYISKTVSKQYNVEIEFLGIRNLVYGGLLSIFSCSYNRKYAKDLLESFENEYKKWEANYYIGTLPFYKKIFVKFAKKRCFLGLKLLSIVHKLLV